MTDLAIILPARNEAAAIVPLLVEIINMVNWLLPDDIDTEVYVLDGESEDGTKAAANGGATVLDVPRGKGNGVRAGLAQIDADYYILLDSDGSYCPEYIPVFLHHLTNGADVVMGARVLQEPGSMPPMNSNGNKFITWVANLLYGTHIADLCTGYWGFTRHVVEQLDIQSEGFTLEVELFTKVVKHGWRLEQVATRYRPRIGKRHINRLDHLRILWYLVKHRSDRGTF